MAESEADRWLTRSEKLFTANATQHTLHDALAEIFYPERADFISQQPLGVERYADLVDGWPAKMRWDLANALGALIRPRGKEWFMTRAFPRELNQQQEVMEWCDVTTERLRDIIYAPDSQFTRAMAQSDNDFVTFGTSVVFITYNRDRSGVLFRCLHPRDVAFIENAEGEVDIMCERPRYTARQLGQLLPSSKLSKAMRKAVDVEPERLFDCARIVAPRNEFSSAKTWNIPRDASFVSLLIDRETRTVLNASPYFSFPYLVRRWLTVSGEVWGRSPCTTMALGEGRMAQKLRLALIEAIEKAVDPPTLVAHEGVMSELQLHAGGVIFAQAGYDLKNGAPVQSLQTNTMPNHGIDLQGKQMEFMAAAFLQNVLKLPTDQTMTAYEVGERIEEYIRSAAPVFEPMEADNARMMRRVADLAERRGAFLPRPDVLWQAAVRWEFETPLTAAFDKLALAQAKQVMEVTAGLASFDGGAKQRPNWEQIQRDVMRGLGPARWMRPAEESDQAIAAQGQEDQVMKLLSVAKESGILDHAGEALTGALSAGGAAAPAADGAMPAQQQPMQPPVQQPVIPEQQAA